MKITTWVGVAVFLVGILIMGAYSMYPLFKAEAEESTILLGIKISIAMMAIGAAILIP